MAATNFAKLTDHEKKLWSMSFWKTARERSFMTRLLGSSQDAVIQRITELKKTVKGTKAIITLVPDSLGDGIAGDRTLKGNEEALRSFEDTIRIDQLRHAHKSGGRIADQKSIVDFRKVARDTLAYWIGDRIDQMAILTMSGVTLDKKNNGAPRVGSDLQYLEWAADITPPSANRHFRWDVDTVDTMQVGDTTAVTAADKPSYRMLIEAKALMQDLQIKPVRGELGTELYHVFMTPQGVKHLKLDDDFMKAWREAMPRSPNNPIFKGFDTIYLDGLAIHTHRYVYNTKGAAAGSKWGTPGNVDGQRVIFAGTQALAYADIGSPYWDEEDDDYNNQHSIAVGKIFGFKKPVFFTDNTSTAEDFGLMVVDTAI
jgi:N4-gp56 family major capsid protein